MKRTTLALLVALTIATAARAADVLPVFVFAGQSNANGFGIASQLPASLQQPQANVLFDNAYVNATPAWPRPLTPPTEPASRYQFGGQYLIDYANGAFGAELTTGLGISSAMGGQQVAEVKYSQGGTSLAGDWNPDTPAGQMLYPSMVSQVTAAVAALRNLYPTKTVQIGGFFWMQGESDTDGPTYQNNLVSLISHVRTDFGNPNLPFIIGQLGAAWTGNAISQAQANVGTPGLPTYVHDTLMVTTADLPIIFDGMHFNTVGVQKLGNRYAAAYETLTGLPVQSLGVSVSDANLLKGKQAVASSQYGASYLPSQATDGTSADHVFADGDTDMRVVIHGFQSDIRQIRIWRDMGDANRVPAQVTIRSSTSDHDSLGDAFETSLVDSMVLGPSAFGDDGYATISARPTGTRSLFFDFGSVDSNGSHYGVRIMEIQAFATPEPSALVLVSMGLLGLLVYAWRRRK